MVNLDLTAAAFQSSPHSALQNPGGYTSWGSEECDPQGRLVGANEVWHCPGKCLGSLGQWC